MCRPRCLRAGVAEPRLTVKAVRRERREVSRAQSNAARGEVLRSFRPPGRTRPGSSAGGLRPGATLRLPEELSWSSQRDQHSRYRASGPCLWCRKGGNALPSSIGHAPSLRDTQGVTPFVYAGSSVGRRFPSLRVRTVRREQAPAMGYGCRRGANLRRVQALVGMRTVSEPSSVGDDMLCGNPANPMSGTGMQQARSLRCGASRRSGEIPQGRNMNRGRHTAVRTRASAWVEWTRVGTSEEGHPTIPEESDLAPFVEPAMA